ncbi:hypothetical protein HRO26_05105 [Treponema pectinovorum]|uniref:hypothetical protein n=1 Tax=Treponema pectinovorum TaxID=164 RepID=UPI003D8FFD43
MIEIVSFAAGAVTPAQPFGSEQSEWTNAARKTRKGERPGFLCILRKLCKFSKITQKSRPNKKKNKRFYKLFKKVGIPFAII